MFNFINWILEKILGTGDGTDGIKQQEQIPEPVIESIPEPELTELQQLILEKCCKVFNVDENYIIKRLRDSDDYGLISNLYITFVFGKFKFTNHNEIKIGIYDATEPELYQQILSIYSFENKIKVNYISGIWDSEFLKALDDYIEFKKQELQKKIDEDNEKERIKQERIQKMFSETT